MLPMHTYGRCSNKTAAPKMLLYVSACRERATQEITRVHICVDVTAENVPHRHHILHKVLRKRKVCHVSPETFLLVHPGVLVRPQIGLLINAVCN